MLRCFVAMAIGEDDTDQLFEKIKKELERVDVDARRVDRIEHNNNIDDQILHEIKSSDLVVADLTYARPSVYFEAGYAEREVPVIFTCRKDHFRPRESDVFGNFRVHFDLQMKNIIAWTTPSDSAFYRRLLSRVKKVIQPLIRAAHKKELQDAEEQKFKSLSEVEKSLRIKTQFINSVKGRYKITHDFLYVAGGIQREGKKLRIMLFARLDSWAVTSINSHLHQCNSIIYSLSRNDNTKKLFNNYDSINVDLFFWSTAGCRLDSVRRALRTAVVIDDVAIWERDKTATWSSPLGIMSDWAYKNSPATYRERFRLAIIDVVKSEKGFSERLKKQLAGLSALH